MHSFARAVAIVAAAFTVVGPAVGADPTFVPLPALDTRESQQDVSIDLVRYRGPGGPGPATYFFTEATFFSRQYDVQSNSFGLVNSTPTLNVPPGTLPNDGTYTTGTIPGDPTVYNLGFNSTYNPYAYSWTPGTLQPVNSITSPYSSADQLTGAPRLTLGHVFGNGWGVQGRYWTMENAVGYDALGPVAPAGPFSANNFNGVLGRTNGGERFTAQTIDLEATRDLSIGRWWGLGTIGARYAEFTNYRTDSAVGRIRTGADETGNAQIPNIDQYSNAMYTFGNSYGSAMYGTGLTFSLQGLRPIGDSDFAIYTVARGSTLWGETQSFAQSDVAYDSFYGSGQSQQSVFNRLDNNQTYYIAELQGGVQWSRGVRWLNGRFFTRAGFEYQWWRGLVNQANSAVGAGDFNGQRTAQDVASSPTTVPSGNPPAGPNPTVPVDPNTRTVYGPYPNGRTDLPQYLRGVGTSGGFASQTGGIADFDLIGFTVGAGFMW